MKRQSASLLAFLILILCMAGAYAQDTTGYVPGDHMDDVSFLLPDGTETSLLELLDGFEGLFLYRIPEAMNIPDGMLELLAAVSDTCSPTIRIMVLTEKAEETADILCKKSEEEGRLLIASSSGWLTPCPESEPQPLFLMIDRNGIVACMGKEEPLDAGEVIRLLDIYTGEEYETMILECLPWEPANAEACECTYSFRVVDADGDGVSGVMIQVCNENTCSVLATDADGKCGFTSEPYAWEIHILMVPSGYEKPLEVWKTELNGGDLQIRLQKEN